MTHPNSRDDLSDPGASLAAFKPRIATALYTWPRDSRTEASGLQRHQGGQRQAQKDAELEFIVFSYILKDSHIHILADSDEHEVVQGVQLPCQCSAPMLGIHSVVDNMLYQNLV